MVGRGLRSSILFGLEKLVVLGTIHYTPPHPALAAAHQPHIVCLLLDGRYLSVAFWLLLVLSYLATNLAFSLCISLRTKMSTDDITLARVLVSEVLFLTLALLLAILVVIVYTTSVGRIVLEAQVVVMRLA